jgi:nicotinamide-nucleotide amidase
VAAAPEPPSSAWFVSETAHDLAEQILARLRARGHTVAVAESLTGGLVAAALTDIPGASASFRGGVVTYATELKAALLGVDPVDGQPVGTAHVAVSAEDDTVVRTIALAGDRHGIRRLAVEHALGLLLGRLGEDSG